MVTNVQLMQSIEQRMAMEVEAFFNALDEYVRSISVGQRDLEKTIDSYEIEQLCYRISQFQTSSIKVDFLKRDVVKRLKDFNLSILANQEKQLALIQRKIIELQSQTYKMEMQSKNILISKLLRFKSPLCKEYYKSQLDIEEAKDKIEILKRQLYRERAKRASVSASDIIKLLKSY